MLWALVVLLLTLVLGRFFCGWVCPFGSLHHLVGWIARPADVQRRIEGNRYRCANALKYYLLAGLLAAALAGSLQIGWLDPIVTLSRAFTTSVWPLADGGRGVVAPPGAVYRLRKAECYVCLNCLDDCPYGALAFRFLPDLGREVTDPTVAGRRLVLGALLGFLFVPMSRAGGEVTARAGRGVNRPPGALAEADFLARCTKCGQCVRVCPTNVLQPAFFEAGLEGFGTPVLDNRVGYCELTCVLCGQVCETGAIERITIERKLGLGEYEGRPVRLGTAFFDRRLGRLLALATPAALDARWWLPAGTDARARAAPDLAVVHDRDAGRAARRAVELLGGMSRFVTRGDVVFVKPNIGFPRTPAQGANTHPDVVAAVVKLCYEAGAKRVVVGDHTLDIPERCYRRSGIQAAAAAAGADVVSPEASRFRRMRLRGEAIDTWEVFVPAVEADVRIDVPVAKHHSLTGVTGAMKNWFGAIGGARGDLHGRIHPVVVDLARFFAPALTVLDALPRLGPQRTRRRQSHRRGAAESRGGVALEELLEARLLGE